MLEQKGDQNRLRYGRCWVIRPRHEIARDLAIRIEHYWCVALGQLYGVQENSDASSSDFVFWFVNGDLIG